MILSAGLSPAWQQILTFDRLNVGEVNRACESMWCASGKVLNAGRAVWSLGGDGQILCPVGGLPGEAIRSEFASAGIPATWIETATATRTCTTIIDRSTPLNPQITELVENARPVSADELALFESRYSELVSSADVLILTGSLPDVVGTGLPVALYRRLLPGDIPAILDVRGPELREALPQRPLLVKPNRSELSTTVNRTLPDDAAVVSAMFELNSAGAKWVLVSDGPRPALLTDGTNAWRLRSPACEVVNPIGCGDCLAAGIAFAVQKGAEVVEAVRFGMAAAIVNLGQLLPARLALAAVRRCADDVVINRQTH